MPRLFLALDFPDDILDAVAALQQPLDPAVRWMPRCQLHLTVHFLGERSLAAIQAALAKLELSAFEIVLHGVGQFRAADGGTILWVGIEACPALLKLHRELAAALAVTGFQPESRPYSPHLTVARCRPAVSAVLLRQWKEQHRLFRSDPIPIRHVTLYSSTLQPDGPVYRAEQTLAFHTP